MPPKNVARTFRKCPVCGHAEQPNKPRTDIISVLEVVTGRGKAKIMSGRCTCPICNSEWKEVWYAKSGEFVHEITYQTDHKPRLFPD